MQGSNSPVARKVANQFAVSLGLIGLLLAAVPGTALGSSTAAGTAPTSAMPATAAVALQTAVIDSFDASAPTWYVASGSGTVSEAGGSALALSYNFASATQIQMAPTKTIADLPGLPRSVCVDVKGDGSWNVVYLQLRDETGEIFDYHMGNLSFTGWGTLCIKPGTDAPATTIGGNADGVVDLPLAAFRLVLDKNPGRQGFQRPGSVRQPA